MTVPHAFESSTVDGTEALDEIADHVLWLSTAMIHHANRIRPNPSGLKVGGHQASCASMVSIMTALYFGQLRAGDRVSVKPHASPVLHAINYLLGELDEAYLTRLREFGGLQSYPEPDQGSRPGRLLHGVGGNRCHGADLGCYRAPVRRRRIRCHRHRPPVLAGRRCRTGRGRGVGGDPGTVGGRAGRDRLDRRHEPAVVGPGSAQHRGWPVGVDVLRGGLAGDRRQVRPALGSPLQTAGRPATAPPHPGHAQPRIPTTAAMQRRRAANTAARRRPRRRRNRRVSSPNSTTTRSPPRSRNLGGHDLDALREAYAQIDDTRPTVIIAYTIKGYGLPIQGHPQNHSSLLTEEQFSELAASLGKDAARPWSRFDADSAAGRICLDARERLRRNEIPMTHGARGARGGRPHTVCPSRPRRRRWAGRCWT